MRIAAVTLVALVLAAPVRASSKVHKGATALTWLTAPEHQHFGTPRSRGIAKQRASALLFQGFREHNWYSSALCVHRYEGSWFDDGAPYYGGMQMDETFMQENGPTYYRRWGTADRWPVWAQLYVSYRAYVKRGWWPWPNTARYCGLI